MFPKKRMAMFIYVGKPMFATAKMDSGMCVRKIGRRSPIYSASRSNIFPIIYIKFVIFSRGIGYIKHILCDFLRRYG